MNLQTLAQNIRRLRTAKRFSQKGLAEASGLSLPAVKNLELAKNEPRMRTLQAIATALDVKLYELFLPVRPLRSVRFRSAKRMQNRENILAEVSRWLNDFNDLEVMLNRRVRFKLEGVWEECSKDNIVEAAALCRKKLRLKSSEPIYDICGLLEAAGVKVRLLSLASNSFFGLSVAERDGGPAIVVNAWERIPVERRIFSAAHELGHLMLHRDAFDVSQTKENKIEEKEADLFAGHFLMPNEGFIEEWNDTCGLNLVDRVFKIKRIFRVSYKTVLFRLKECAITDDSIWMRLNQAYQRRYNRKLSFKEEPLAIDSSEPCGLKPVDFQEDRFSRLVREAVEKDKISLSRGAEMLGIGVEDMQEILRNWGTVQ
ncbi:MAG: ImmA/IrrE family metallo-endopeptidase [Lentisphaerae bacterium]|nr:MAG: ImmA/IrrE family metallo-endopeptidase [Lentisphaerota bacterium]